MFGKKKTKSKNNIGPGPNFQNGKNWSRTLPHNKYNHISIYIHTYILREMAQMGDYCPHSSCSQCAHTHDIILRDRNRPNEFAFVLKGCSHSFTHFTLQHCHNTTQIWSNKQLACLWSNPHTYICQTVPLFAFLKVIFCTTIFRKSPCYSSQKQMKVRNCTTEESFSVPPLSPRFGGVVGEELSRFLLGWSVGSARPSFREILQVCFPECFFEFCLSYFCFPEFYSS